MSHQEGLQGQCPWRSPPSRCIDLRSTATLFWRYVQAGTECDGSQCSHSTPARRGSGLNVCDDGHSEVNLSKTMVSVEVGGSVFLGLRSSLSGFADYRSGQVSSRFVNVAMTIRIDIAELGSLHGSVCIM